MRSLVGTQTSESAPDRRRAPGRVRLVFSLAFGVAAVVAAVVAAIGPAVEQQALISWPGAELRSGSPPARSWLTPVLLARTHPQEIAATVPCGAAPRLRPADDETVLLATARDAAAWNALEVTRRGGVIALAVGGKRLATLDAPPRGPCSLDIRLRDTSWSADRDGARIGEGTLAAPAGLSALITELDLSRPTGLRVDVRPYAQDNRPSTSQTITRLVGFAFLLTAIGLAVPTVFDVRPRRPRLGRPSRYDVVVGGVIGVWWFLSPLYFDDGWVRARELNSLASGGFSSYYEHFGADLPLDVWVEWLQHFVVAHTASLALHRLPAVALAVGTWLVCRSTLTRIVSSGRVRPPHAWWPATVTFCVGVTAFGITLRPEPILAFLAVCVLACCVRYEARPSVGVAILAALLAGLAVTAHPAGIVAAAPIAVCLPRLWRDARRGTEVSALGLATAVPIGIACTTLLAFLDSDLSSRRENVALIRDASLHDKGPLQELERYANLSEPGASALRREFVVFLVLVAVVGVVGRVWGQRTLAELLPSASVGLALLLLAFTPSKWIWHFGGLVGIAAVAVGVECERLARTRLAPLGRLAIGTVVTLLCAAAVAHAAEWGPLDSGRTMLSRIPAVLLGSLGLAAVVVGVFALAGRLRRPELALIPAFGAATVALSIAALSVDAASAPGWTVPRQVGSSLLGANASCGLAEDIVVPTEQSIHGLAPAAAESSGDQRRALARRGLQSRPSATPWYRLPSSEIGALVPGRTPTDARYGVVWGKLGARRVTPLGRGVIELPLRVGGPGRLDWELIPEARFPARPRGADVVRIVTPRAPTRPARLVSFRRARLAVLLRDRELDALVDPFVIEATPCVGVPRLAYGTAAVPKLVVDWNWGPTFDSFSSPFRGAADVLETVGVPVEGWDSDRKNLVVFWVIPNPADRLALATTRFVG